MFRRARAFTVVIFVLGAAYSEDAAPMIQMLNDADDELKVSAVSPPSPSLELVLQAENNPVELAPDAPTWSSLLQWLLSHGLGGLPACLQVPPRDLDHLDFVVEDTTYLGNGQTERSLVPSCTKSNWQPTCWHLGTDPYCVGRQLPAGGLTIVIERPSWAQNLSIQSRVSYDCALVPVAP
jgi:hypothetical protein